MTISGNDPSEKPLKTKPVVTDGTAAGGAVTRGTTPNVDRPKEQSPVSLVQRMTNYLSLRRRPEFFNIWLRPRPPNFISENFHLSQRFR